MVQSVVEQPAFAWRITLKRRVVVAVILLVAWSAAIEARLVYLQVGRHADLTGRAERQQLRTVETTAKRGDILDRSGRVLAYSVDADSIYAVPTDIPDPDAAAAALCNALDGCVADERQALAGRIRRGRAFAYVRRQVSPDEARRVAALDLEGIGFMKENRRFYPNKDLAAHVLGYVGIDNTGLNGLEAAYDTLVKGRPGTVLIQTDARRRAFSRIERPPTTGATLELTVDQYLQHVAERELRAGVEENRAAGGTAVVMDPRTGEILALANWPTFNPNAYRAAGKETQRNRAIQDLYEPGSTFKIVTASAAFEEHVVEADDPIDVSAGNIRFGARVIDDDHRYGVLSFTDVIVKSSNVGAIKVGMKLGPERLGLYTKRFGFGRRSSPDFPGESAGIVWDPSKLTPSALASVSMGYQVGVTPLQMAAAVSSIANGGELFEPRIVRAVITDGARTPVPHKVVGRTVSAGTAALLTGIMEQVVTRGTGTRAKVLGFTAAGKTGTAQKVINGRYSTSEYNASFVGFIPSRQPLFAIVVVIDSPHGKNLYYGGSVAAPIFQRIAEASLRHQGVPPSIDAAPPVLVARREDPRERPTSGPAELPAIVALGGGTTGSAPLFPDLRGLGARDALRMLARIGLTARLHGAGIVVEQDPAAGGAIERGAVATLRLERDVRADATLLSATAATP
ncbi:MAG: PASTA domain-containing protein [Acidobacteria bacterium]|nr:PASTA domain-containing protein [Acidobacteriota bacterium]